MAPRTAQGRHHSGRSMVGWSRLCGLLWPTVWQWASLWGSRPVPLVSGPRGRLAGPPKLRRGP
eukprot:12536082-Prorocentrum_lima.AAC.1